MRRAEVLIHGIPAGILEEIETGKKYRFIYFEKLNLFNLTLFNYLVGNEDMHLKNFSVIRRDLKVELFPAYDLLNSTIILNSQEELALPLRGKKSKKIQQTRFNKLGIDRIEGLEIESLTLQQ